jgi:hypothetical protein
MTIPNLRLQLGGLDAFRVPGMVSGAASDAQLHRDQPVKGGLKSELGWASRATPAGSARSSIGDAIDGPDVIGNR